MPSQIGKLKDLHILSNFIMGKKNNLNIKELQNMPHLQGELCISQLDNIVNIQVAMDGGLKLKHNLESLVIRWNSELDYSGEYIESEKNQIYVLDSLEP